MIFKTKTDDVGKNKLTINNPFKNLFNGSFFKKESIISDYDIKCLKAYNAELQRVIGYESINGEVTPIKTSVQTAFNKTMREASIEAQNMAASANGMAVSLSQIPKSSKAAAMGLNLLKTAGNVIATMAISKGIELLVQGIDNWVHRVEIARERTSELFNEFGRMNETMANHKKTVANTADRYDELSKGVDLSTNENKSLSTKEYEEFLNINEQLADSFPKLKSGIDENGNSILSLGQKGLTAKEELQGLLQAEENLNNFKIAQNLKDAFAGVVTYVEETDVAEEDLNKLNNKTNTQMGRLKNFAENGISLDKENYLLFNGNITDTAITDYAYAMQSSAQDFFYSLSEDRRRELESKGVNASTLFTMDIAETTDTFDFYANLYSLESDEIGDLESKISENTSLLNGFLSDQFSSQKQEALNIINQAQNIWTDFLPNLVAGMKSKQTFKDLDSDLQDMAVQIVEGLDYTYATAMQEYNPNDPYAYIRDKLIVPMSNLSDSDKNSLKSNFEELFKLDPENISQNNQEKITKVINTIAGILKNDPIKIRAILGFDIDDIQQRYNAALRDAKLQLGGYGYDDRGFESNNEIGNNLDAFWKENVLTEDDWILWQKVTAGINDATEAMNAYTQAKSNSTRQNEFSTSSFQQTWDSLDTTENEELNGMKGNLLTLAGTGRLTRDTFNETEGSSTFLSMFGIKPEDKTEIDVLISKINQLKSSSEQLSSMKNGISGLSDNLSYREQNPGEAISSDVLVGMDSGLKDQTEEWKQYEFVLGNAGSSMDEVREATNKLASAYVNSNNFLANLTEANKDYYVSQLDAMGVANSAEIVEERVNAQKEVAEYKTHALSLATKDLKDSQASYTQRSVDCVNATYENSTAFARQTEMTDLARILLADLVAQESIFASTDLNTSAKISELNKLAYAYFGVANAIQISSAMGSDPRYWNNPGDYEKAVHNNWDNLFKKQKQGLPVNLNSLYPQNTNNTGNTNKSPDKQPDKQPEEREFKESFNWVERFIKKFQNAFDKWLAQAETALTSKFLDIYYKKAATSAKSQLSSYDKAYNRYMREANAVGLDEKYAKKVRNGTVNIEEIYAKGSEDDVKKYEELAKKIKDYQDWYDKAQDSMNSFREVAEKLYNLPLDKAAKKVDIFSDAIDLLNKELDNETDYKNKNKMIGNKGDKNKNTLSSYKKATLNSYKTAESDTEKALNNARKELRKSKNLNKDDGITAKERKIIKKATKSKDAKKNKEINLAYFKENSAGYKKAVKYNEALKAYKKAANDAASAQQDYNAWLVEASKLKFDNIADHYDKKVQMFGYDMSSYDNTISEIEASGKKVHKFYYESQRNINQDILSQYLAEKTDLEKSLNNITEGTDEWYDAYDKIQQVSTAISECKQKTCELNNAINQLHFDMFDDISEGIERIVSEQEFLQGLFAHEKTTDKTTGNFTEAGLAKLGSLAVIHYAYEDDLQRYSTEITELKRMLASGSLQSSTLGLTFNSRDDAEAYLEKMYDQYRDAKNKMYGIDTEIHNRMEEFYQTELDYLSELIGAKKEALNAEKDLHDYQRTISEKTEGIATIRKQIAAYSGDTSQEGMAKLQRLQKELTDREDDLKETEYNRLISDQQDMLDKLYDEYSQKLEEKMENFMVLVQEGLGKANDNMSGIRDYLEKIANDSKYDLEINGLFEGPSKIETNVENATSKIVKDKNAQYESTKPNVITPAPTPKKNTPKKNNKKNSNKKNNNKKKSSNTKKKSSSSKKNASSQQEIVLKEFTPKRITPKTEQVLEISQDFLHLESDIPFKDYRNQKSLIRDHWEQETLTGNSLERISNTYAVFDAEKPRISSEHILDATIPTFNIKDVVPDLSATPRINNLSNVVNIDSITLPNVTNYDEFKDRMFHDMQNDGHYIQFVNDASVNRADGAGRLTKNTQTI